MSIPPFVLCRFPQPCHTDIIESNVMYISYTIIPHFEILPSFHVHESVTEMMITPNPRWCGLTVKERDFSPRIHNNPDEQKNFKFMDKHCFQDLCAMR